MFDSKPLFYEIMFDFEMGFLSEVLAEIPVQYGITNVVSILISESEESPEPEANINDRDKKILETYVGKYLICVLFEIIIVKEHE